MARSFSDARDRGRKAIELIQLAFEHIADPRVIDIRVEMREHVAQPSPSLHRHDELGIQNAMVSQDLERLAVGVRRAPTAIGDQV